MERRQRYTVGRRTGTGAGASVEGSTAGVTSVGLSSGLGTAAVVVGSDIMLWEREKLETVKGRGTV